MHAHTHLKWRSMFLSHPPFTGPVGISSVVWSVAKLPGLLLHPGRPIPPCSLSLSPSATQSHTLYTCTHSHFNTLSYTHTIIRHHGCPLCMVPNRKVSWLRAGIKQTHLIEEATRDRAKTAAALTFHVRASHASDNSVHQQKL